MIFVDASVLVAIIGEEEDGLALLDRLEFADRRLYSAVAQWETIIALCRSFAFEPVAAREAVEDFLKSHDFEMVPIGEDEARLSFEAARRYGRGRHPAALNMGDCFAYACAKSHGAALLYKGDDFAKTDLA